MLCVGMHINVMRSHRGRWERGHSNIRKYIGKNSTTEEHT